MAREWRLNAPHAGPGVPTELVGDVRVVTNDAAWISSEAGSVLISLATGLAGPITVGMRPPDELTEGHRVFISCASTSPSEPFFAALSSSSIPEHSPLLLDDEWLSSRAAELGASTSVRIAGEIAGRGRGLTPSGDDVLIGYMLARHALQVDGWEDEVARIFEIVEERSGEPAVSLARWAAKGQGFVMVLRALGALLEGAPDEHQYFTSLALLGKETGCATLLGMVAGAKAG